MVVEDAFVVSSVAYQDCYFELDQGLQLEEDLPRQGVDFVKSRLLQDFDFARGRLFQDLLFVLDRG